MHFCGITAQILARIYLTKLYHSNCYLLHIRFNKLNVINAVDQTGALRNVIMIRLSANQIIPTRKKNDTILRQGYEGLLLAQLGQSN